MGRWQPDARGRLIQAAMELYGERGFEQTTVAEIAARAGLTERTFFRHFSDKREVLFFGAQALEEAMVGALDAAPREMPAFDAIGVALDATAAILPERAEYARYRHRIVASNPDLQERERIKLAGIAHAVAQALRRRGVAEHTAVLTAEMGVAVFRIAYDRWIDEQNTDDFTRVVRATLEELRAIAAG